MPAPHPLLLLIDGHALAFRAFHALKEQGLRASTGEPTYAIFGFTSIMLNAIREYQPEYVIVTFDIGRTFRDDLYAEYKAGRVETPQEFEQQLARIKELLIAFSIPILTAEGFEADDVIGTLGVQAAVLGVTTLVLTGDTDTLQLVNERVHVLLANPYQRGDKNTTYYTETEVVERYNGLRPAQLTDLRGLKGDTSDNIPGVKGIGEAGAVALLKEFGTVEGIYDNLTLVPKRYQKPLDGQRDAAMFSKKLATIVCDAPVTIDLKLATLREYDRQAVIRIFQELEMGKTLITRLPASGAMETVALPAAPGEHFAQTAVGGATAQLDMFGGAPAAPAAPIPALGEYTAVTTPAQLAAVVAALVAAAGFAFDVETHTADADSISPLRDPLVGISVATEVGSAWYIPLGHTTGEQLPREIVFAALRPIFGDPQKQVYAHNAKFDIEVLGQPTVGIPVANLAFDTMIAAQLLDKRRGLKELALYELKLVEPMTEYEAVAGKGKTQISFADVPIDRATPYAAADADMTLRLVHALAPQIAANGQLEQVFRQIEMPLLPVIVRMEQAGIALDAPFMRAVGVRMTERLAALEQQIFAVAGGKFNINSGDQLSDVLFGKLGIDSKGLDKTKTGKFSLTAQVLEDLRARDVNQTGIVDLILQHRQLSKLKSTYVDALPEMIHERTGRVHTQYSQIGAATGRMASNKPNLQNIPTRTDEGRELRRGFVARPGHRFIAADYSQIELRVLAHIAQDEALTQAFEDDLDIHSATAAQLFAVPLEQVDKNQRRLAKLTVFGVIYGISAFGLAQRTMLSRGEAQQLIDELFGRFPRIREYIDRTLAECRRDGYVQSLFGRRRNFHEINVKGPRQAAAQREAVNAPIQATAADLMKMAMIAVDHALRAAGLQTQILLQVHDELILEAPEAEVQQAALLVCETMEQIFGLRVPLKVDVESGQNWLEMADVQTRMVQ